MQEAIEYINELKDRIRESGEEDDATRFDKLKPDVNNLLHVYLPGDITIHEVEILASVVCDIIVDPRRYLGAK